MEDKTPYSISAEHYDDIYSRITPVFRKVYELVLSNVHSKIVSMCDLCSGSGSHAIHFAKKGIEVYAVDKVDSFGTIIRNKALKAKVDVQYIQADMKDFHLPKKVDLVTCMFDSLNMLESKSDLRIVFKRTSNILETGGYFAFDVNTEKALKKMWPNFPAFIYEGKDWVCIRRGKPYDTQREIGAMESLLFKQKEQGLWSRQVEIYNEIAWTDQEIKKALEDTGFRVLHSWDAHELGTSSEEGLRYFYLAQSQN
jgi:SAM-dependent methyltransferase